MERIDRLVATHRYRARLVRYRFSLGLPSVWELVSLLLALIGAWTVLTGALRSITSIGNLAPTTMFAILAFVTIWFRVAFRPQSIFRLAAADVRRSHRLRHDLLEGLKNEQAYDALLELYRALPGDLGDRLPAQKWTIPKDCTGRELLCLVSKVDEPSNLSNIIEVRESKPSGEWEERTAKFAAERQIFMESVRGHSQFSNDFGDEVGFNLVSSQLRSNPTRILTSTAQYGQIVRTSDSLIDEFALFAFLTSERRRRNGTLSRIRFPNGDLLHLLPWRRAIHSWAGSSINVFLRPGSRASGIGVATATIFAGITGAPSVVVARRSARVGTYPDAYHVVPSGMLAAPSARSPVGDLVQVTMMSEFLEEFFGMAEFEADLGQTRAIRVQKALTEKCVNAKPQLTGLAFDLLNLRFEICGLLDLRQDPEILEAISLSWEYSNVLPFQLVQQNTADRIPGKRTEYVQSGLACMGLAFSHLMESPS